LVKYYAIIFLAKLCATFDSNKYVFSNNTDVIGVLTQIDPLHLAGYNSSSLIIDIFIIDTRYKEFSCVLLLSSCQIINVAIPMNLFDNVPSTPYICTLTFTTFVP
jgi:hypothetical protein